MQPWKLAALFGVGCPGVTLAQQKAFPEAEGFGQFASGARTNLSAASVYHVTNLNDSGPGSFRDAVSQSNRFIVFDVGGIVTLNSAVSVDKSNLTIAGQTAPGGISFYGDKVSFSGANNLIARHVAIRKGEAGTRQDTSGLSRGSNMIFDHMSITWGVDETFSMNPESGQTIDNITIQNSIIGQGLDRLGHSAGGLMTIGEGNRFSIIKSLFADNVTRNPKVRGENEFINNVVYGYETAGYIMGDTMATSHANAIGNYFIEGPVDGSSPFASGTSSFHIYGSDNWGDTNRNGALDGSLITSYPGADVVSSPFAFPTAATMTARQAVAHVIENVGLSIVRDAVDQRIVDEVASYGTLGGVILRDTDLFPGYATDPKYLNVRARLVDTDNDGMADNWETSRGLNPNSATDFKSLNAAGYARLEEYLNELGADGVDRTSTGSAWTTAATWGGATPTLADDAIVSGNLTLASGNGFARRLTLTGGVNATGGTLDVFDTMAINGTATIGGGGTVTAGRVLLASTGETAALTLNAGGTLQTATIGSAGGTASLVLDGGTIRFLGVPHIAVPLTVGAGGGTLNTNSYSGTIAGSISGAGTLTKAGAGTLTLGGDNAGFGGGVNLNGGAIKMGHNRAAGTGPITVGGGGGIVQLANGVTLGNDIRTNYLFEVLDVPDPGAAATFAGALTQIGSNHIRIQTTGAGATLNLTGSVDAADRNFFLKTGNVVVAGNGSIAGTGGAVGWGGGATSLTLRDNASFNIGGFSIGGGQALPSGVITVRDNARLTAGAGALDLLNTTTATSSSTLNLDGGTTTAASLTKTSTGASQTARLNFNGGTLKYGGTAANENFLNARPGLTANVRAGGARIDDNGQAITIALPLVHDPALGATRDGGLIKSGLGTLTLSGANTYTGDTLITGGTLAVNGAHTGGGAYTVSNGGTLAGNGAIAGAITVNTGGTLSPGSSAGVLSTGSVTLASGAGFLVELDAAADYDQLNVTGAVTLAGADLIASLNYTPQFGDMLFLIANDGTDAITTRFENLPEGALLNLISSADQKSYAFRISYAGNVELNSSTGGNDVFLTAVPEPAAGALVLVTMAGFLTRRRSRK